MKKHNAVKNIKACTEPCAEQSRSISEDQLLMRSISYWGTPLLVLLAGFALRLFRLGAQSLWYDETVSAVLAQKSALGLIAHTARDIHPPGYYLLLRVWTQLAGNSEFALAYFSLIFGVALIAAAYLLSRSLFNRQVALWTAGVIAFSPFNVWYAQEVRMYTLGSFLGVWVVYWALRGMGLVSRSAPPTPQRGEKNEQSPSLWGVRGAFPPWTYYALISALGLYVLYYFAFLLIALNLFLLGMIIFRLRKYGLDQQRPALRDWLLANAAIVLLYLPWLGTAWRQATNPPVPVWRSFIPLPAIALESWSALSLGESVGPGQLWPLLLLILGLYGLGIFAAKPIWKQILLPLLTFGPLALIVFAPYITGSPLYHVRYLFTYSAFFYIALGAGLTWLWLRQKIIAAIISLLLIAGAGLSIYQLHTDPQFAADDFRGAVRFIQEKWRPGDVVLVNAGYTYTALQYYFTGPVDDNMRLTNFNPETTQSNPYAPLVLQSGSVNGPPSLGWGDSQSDFYTMGAVETTSALEAIAQTYPRIWMLRAYDTVTDEQGLIRQWLSENTMQFEDQVFTGASNIRVQGFMSKEQSSPPQPLSFNFDGLFRLSGFAPIGETYRAGQNIHTALWLEALAENPSDAPVAISLKLWDSEGNQMAQSDEWPVGSLYFTPNWQPGKVIRYPMRLALPADIAPGQYWLDLVLYRSDTGIPLPVAETGQQSAPLGGVEIVGK